MKTSILLSNAKMQLVPRIWGGLGNQLFVYAAARSMAESLQAELRLDVLSGFARDHLYRREYLLDQFCVTAHMAARSDCFLGRTGWIWEQLVKRVSKLGIGGVRFIREGDRPPAGPFKKLFLRGYWQSESYFVKHSQIIRSEIQPKEELSAAVLNERHLILACEEPIAIGVRRFTEVPPGQRGFVVGADYYERAIAAMEQRFPGGRFFVFTEDSDWARSFLHPRLPYTFISPKKGNRRAIEDLNLMSLCRHFIVGNSSFHWWGAWLNNAPQKIVCCPMVVGRRRTEYYPQSWIQI